ncbi:MAG: CoA-binding protein [Chloroflexi bacterium]|nr:CoA-binding protein [Chloroflexota bacterium]
MNTQILREFEPIFNPKSIAIVGASEKSNAGQRFLKTIINCGYPGKIYPVNPGSKQILGLTAYPDLISIPESVDYVIISVPASIVLKVLDDCTVKKIKVAHIFSAGFGETGTEEGKNLENAVKDKGIKGGFRIIGPNCMGFYNTVDRGGPYGIGEVALREVGPIGFVSQSGGHAAALIDDLLNRSLGFTQVISFGNGCDLKATDFLEYFAVDPLTKIIGAYIEGTAQGNSFLELAQEISKSKPLLIWKGGKTEAGAQAAASHTGSLAGAYTVWETAIRQAGAICVDNLEEMVDTMMSLELLPHFKGDRVAIIGGIHTGGGGFSVSATDACIRLGLKVPTITEKTRSEIAKYIPPVGAILRNPIDIGTKGQPGRLQKIIEYISDDPNIDLIIIEPTFLTSGLSPMKSWLARAVISLSKDLAQIREQKKKPIVEIFSRNLDPSLHGELMSNNYKAGIPTFSSLERAAKALVYSSQYWRNREML